jgi:hypothetical protein
MLNRLEGSISLAACRFYCLEVGHGMIAVAARNGRKKTIEIDMRFPSAS